jgi:methionine aminopeptidase
MNSVKQAINIVNNALKMAGEELISEPTEGTTIQRLESILDIYTNKLIIMNPQYKKLINKKDIPESVVIYLNNAIRRQECLCDI